MTDQTRTQLPPDQDATRTNLGVPNPFDVPTRTLASPEGFQPPQAKPAGDSLAPPGFTVLGEIGRGGMGAVYRAHDRELNREVALKVLQDRYGPHSSAAERFLEESRITSQLQHPGIPAVYQVGRLTDGRPFLAMKLIRGRTLDEILKSGEPVNVPAVLEAMAQAVGYAHDRQVIHRDLKPQNVMVGAFGEVQVMDWGLAKLLGSASPPSEPGEATQDRPIDSGRVRDSFNTQAGSVMGTLAYMAPEQAAGQTDQVNERSDVFGLGAILCQMLTGQPPYAGRDFLSVRANAVRGNMEDALASLAACKAEPELVALCRRCLSFDAAARPATAGELARQVAALRSAADDRARQAELARARAEVQTAEQRKRRRAVLIGAGAAIAVLTAGILATAREYVRAEQHALAASNAETAERQARLAAEDQRRVAVFQTDISTEIRQLFQNVMLQASPMEQAKVLELPGMLKYKPKADRAFKDLLDRAAAKLAPDDVAAKFQDKPLVLAELLQTLGNTYYDIGEYAASVTYLALADRLWRQHKGADDPATLRNLRKLADARFDAANMPEDYEPAITAYTELLESQRALPTLGPKHADTLATATSRANAIQDHGDAPTAIRELRSVLDIQSNELGGRNLETLKTKVNLAVALRESGRDGVAEAVPMLVSVVWHLGMKPGPNHPTTHTAVYILADTLRRRNENNDLDRAFKLFKIAYDGFKTTHGEDHPSTNEILGRVGLAYSARNKPEDAIEMYRRALDKLVKHPGAEHKTSLEVRNNLGGAYFKLMKYPQAVAEFSQVLAARNTIPGPKHPDTLKTRHNLACAHLDNGEPLVALPLLEENAGYLREKEFVLPLSEAAVKELIDCALEMKVGRRDLAVTWHGHWLKHLEAATPPDRQAIQDWKALAPLPPAAEPKKSP